jgi:hypothetical protein
MQESKEIPILHTFTGLSNSEVNEAFKDFKVSDDFKKTVIEKAEIN